jgi:hypothetical protein
VGLDRRRLVRKTRFHRGTGRRASLSFVAPWVASLPE